MGDCWIYYCELCLAGKKTRQKNAACATNPALWHSSNSCSWSRCWFQEENTTSPASIRGTYGKWNPFMVLCIGWPWQNLFWVQKWSRFSLLATSWGIYQPNCLDAQSGTLKRAIIIIYHWFITSVSSDRTLYWYEETLSIAWPLLWGQSLSPGSDVGFLWVFPDQERSCQQVQQHISVSLCQPCQGLVTQSPCFTCSHLSAHIKPSKQKWQRW